MPLDRVPGHPLVAPVDHADGRRGRLPVKGAGVQKCTHGDRAQGEGTVAAVTRASRRVGEGTALGLGNAGVSQRTIQAAQEARTRSSRAGRLKAWVKTGG
jgi:hypothetical protein